MWDALINAGEGHGITPAGIWALDLARIEAGLVMLDVDYFSSHHALIPEQKSSPLELNLGWTVSDNKGPYNGRQALRAEKKRGPAWNFVGIDVSWPALERLYAERGLPPALPTIAWRGSAPILHDGRQVGYATSSCWSISTCRSLVRKAPASTSTNSRSARNTPTCPASCSGASGAKS